MKKKLPIYKRQQEGFTLIEMIISLGIFTVVALVAVGALLKVLDANTKAITFKTTINNMNFALESMSREMRVGKTYHCNDGSTMPPNPLTTSDNCPVSYDSDWLIAFNSSKQCAAPNENQNIIYAYRYISSEQTVQKAQQNSNCSTAITSSSFQDLISRDVLVTDSLVFVVNTGQPRAFFWFKGYNGEKDRERTSFLLQTTVSQRIK
jgi:prepilin-type N-terminal cleavage/methylation domain-containing protein